MFEASVDRLGGAVAGAGPVEVGQHVGGAVRQGRTEPAQLGRRCGDAVADRFGQLRHQVAPLLAVGLAVGGDYPLVDAPGGLDLDVLLGRGQGRQPRALLVGEQVRAGVQCPRRREQRLALAAPVPLEVLLDPAAAVLQCVTGQADDVEGIHHGHSVGQLFRGSGLQPGEPVHREDFHALTPGLRSLGEPLLERLLRAALDQVQQP